MDDRERETMLEETGLGGDIGENVVVAEYDVAGEERRHGERRHGERREGMRAGEATPMLVGTAEGRKVNVNGAVGVARGEKTKVKGIAGVVVGNRTKLTGYTDIAAAQHDVRIEKGGAAVALAGRQLELKDHGYAGVVVAPKVEVKDGGRVLVTALTAILGGLAIGMGWGLVAFAPIWMLRRRGFFGKMRARRMMRTGALGSVTSAGERLAGAVRGAMQH